MDNNKQERKIAKLKEQIRGLQGKLTKWAALVNEREMIIVDLNNEIELLKSQLHADRKDETKYENS